MKESMFFSVIKEECQEMSLSQKENGLLEIVLPKSCDDKELSKYINGLGMEEYNKIVDKQKKSKEVFRKNVAKLIEKYKKEFNLPFEIKLRLQTKSNKLNDCNVEVHGIVFKGNMSIATLLQYFPDDIVEKIIRCTVYMIACEYEELFGRINGITMGVLEYTDSESEHCYYSEIEEEKKYRISLETSEIQKIKSDYELAVKQLFEEMKKKPIMCT